MRPAHVRSSDRASRYTEFRMRGVIPLVAILLAVAGVSAAPAYAVTVEQHPLPKEDNPATAIVGWSGGILVAGPVTTSKGPIGSISFDIVHTAPFSISPGPEGHEAISMAIGRNGEPWVLAQYGPSGGAPASTGESSTATNTATPAIYQANLQAVPPTMSAVYRYTPASGESATATSLVVGPDGALWLADSQVGAVDRYVPGASAIEVLPQPGADSIVALASGDGAIWYTDIVRGTIGEVAPNGESTEHLIADGDNLGDWNYSGPYGITVGPDGSIWFTEKNAGRIGRMTPAGQFTEYAIPDPRGMHRLASGAPVPQDIVAGPEGAMWFTDPGDGSIGRVTQSGEVTEYPVPHSGLAATEPVLPDAITVGPEGDLWFTEEGAKALGSVDPTGVAVAARTPVSKRRADARAATCAISRQKHQHRSELRDHRHGSSRSRHRRVRATGTRKARPHKHQRRHRRHDAANACAQRYEAGGHNVKRGAQHRRAVDKS